MISVTVTDDAMLTEKEYHYYTVGGLGKCGASECVMTWSAIVYQMISLHKA